LIKTRCPFYNKNNRCQNYVQRKTLIEKSSERKDDTRLTTLLTSTYTKLDPSFTLVVYDFGLSSKKILCTYKEQSKPTIEIRLERRPLHHDRLELGLQKLTLKTSTKGYVKNKALIQFQPTAPKQQHYTPKLRLKKRKSTRPNQSHKTKNFSSNK